MAGWAHYFNDPDARLTLDEFMAKALLDIRDNGVLTRLAVEHVESMLGTLDETMASTHGVYRQLADKRVVPVPPGAALNGGAR